MKPPRTKERARLTAQEERVLKLVAEAKTNGEIAAAIGISPSTVKRHVENILRKLRLRNRIAAAIYVVRNGDCALPTAGGPEP